jgi:hypothetical protein
MADEKPIPTPLSDTTPPTGDQSAAIPVFKADEFLAGKKVKGASAPLTQPATNRDTETIARSQTFNAKSSDNVVPTKPQVIKRGGVSFLTALMMSALATAGGAYLALFVQARPDVLKQAGIAPFLPQPISGASVNVEPLIQRISAIEAQLATLQAKSNAGPIPSGASAPTKYVPPSTPPAIAGAPSAATPPTGPATVAAVPSPAQTASATPAPTGAVVADVGLLKSELAGIGGRVTAIETRLAALDPTGAGGAVVAGLQADIASLKATITALQQQVAAAPSPAVTMAVVNLADAAGRSGPFLTEFETMRAAMGNGPEVAALEAFARTGVPTRTMLQERFGALGPALAAATQASQKETGLVVWFRSLLSGMITVKPAPNANGTTGDDVLVRAKAKLDQGDLSGCIDDLATLPNPPAPVTEWMASARKRVDLESRLSAVRGVASRPPPSPPTAFSGAAAPQVAGAVTQPVPPSSPAPASVPAKAAQPTQGTNP